MLCKRQAGISRVLQIVSKTFIHGLSQKMFKRQSLPRFAVEERTGRRIRICLDEVNSVGDLLTVIKEDSATQVGDVSLVLLSGKEIGRSEASKHLDEFDWGKKGIVHFTVKVDADAEYQNARKLEEQLARYFGQLDGLLYTAYGFPMPGKVRKAAVKPGIVVSVRSKHAKYIEQ